MNFLDKEKIRDEEFNSCNEEITYLASQNSARDDLMRKINCLKELNLLKNPAINKLKSSKYYIQILNKDN